MSPEVLLSIESEVGVDTIDHDLVVHTLAGEPLACKDKPKYVPVTHHQSKKINTLSANSAEDHKRKLVARVAERGGQTFSESVLSSFFVFVFDTLKVKFCSVLSNLPASFRTHPALHNGWVWE